MKNITREDFFKDKGLLFLIFTLEIISFFLHLTFIEETYFFLVPICLFGFLGLMELWFIQTKNNLKEQQGK